MFCFLKKHGQIWPCLVCKHILALFNFATKPESPSNHQWCVIPLDWLIQSNFGLDNSLINCDVRDKFLLACSSVESDKYHLEESSLCERSIHRAYDSEFESLLNGFVVIKLVVESSHNHKNSVELDETLIRELTVPDIHFNHFFAIRWINHHLRACILLIYNSNDAIKPLLESKRGVKKSFITPSLSPAVWMMIFFVINPR